MAGETSFDLEPVPPFRLDLTVWTLRRRPDNAVDRWDGSTYRRVLALEGHQPVEVAASQSGPPQSPRLHVVVRGAALALDINQRVMQTLGRLLGTGVDLGSFYELSQNDERLRPLAGQFCGFKPPRFLTPFEALVNAMACQQLTLTVGIRLLNSLAEAYGPSMRAEDGTFHSFPRPEDLAEVDVEKLRKMGFSYQKARYITGLARGITSGEIDLRRIESLDDKKAADWLRSLKGVGRWTAEYCLLRGLGRIQVFPADDVGARNNLQRWLGLPGPMSYDEISRALAPWAGYGGLIYFHLLLKSLLEKGTLPNVSV